MLSARFWGKRSGVIMASVVFSHWLLDLLVHRSDLPLLPGNFGGLPLLGLGVWKYASVSIVIESLLIAIGFAMYFRSLLTENKRSSKAWALTAGGVMGVLLVLSLVTDVLGIG